MLQENAMPPATKGRTWILWLSIITQQSIFLLACGLRVYLIGISEWVIYTPVVIIWALYLIMPLLSGKKAGRQVLLRAYGLTGWVFVAAAVSWTTCYLTLSAKYGTPVSWSEVQEAHKFTRP